MTMVRAYLQHIRQACAITAAQCPPTPLMAGHAQTIANIATGLQWRIRLRIWFLRADISCLKRLRDDLHRRVCLSGTLDVSDGNNPTKNTLGCMNWKLPRDSLDLCMHNQACMPWLRGPTPAMTMALQHRWCYYWQSCLLHGSGIHGFTDGIATCVLMNS